jgi:hypothetical protein
LICRKNRDLLGFFFLDELGRFFSLVSAGVAVDCPEEAATPFPPPIEREGGDLGWINALFSE